MEAGAGLQSWVLVSKVGSAPQRHHLSWAAEMRLGRLVFLGIDLRNNSVPAIQIFRQGPAPSLLQREGDAQGALSPVKQARLEKRELES